MSRMFAEEGSERRTRESGRTHTELCVGREEGGTAVSSGDDASRGEMNRDRLPFCASARVCVCVRGREIVCEKELEREGERERHG